MKTKSKASATVDRYMALFIILTVILVIGLLYPLAFSPYNYKDSITIPYTVKYLEDFNYWLITMEYGRDFLLNLSVGCIHTLEVSLFSLITFTVFGILIGLIMGMNDSGQISIKFFEKLFYKPMMNIQMWVFLFIAALFINKITQNSYLQSVYMFLLFGFLTSPQLGTILQMKIQKLKNEEFIDAAKASGISMSRLIFVHILWYESLGIILLQILHIYTAAIMFELTLTYFGIGFRADSTSLGFVLKSLVSGSRQSYTLLPLMLAIMLILILHSLIKVIRRRLYEG